jgi:hypothetical protein
MLLGAGSALFIANRPMHTRTQGTDASSDWALASRRVTRD